MIFLIAQTFTNGLAYQLEMIYESMPLKILEGRKKDEKELFVARLIQNDQKIDEGLAKNLANKMIQHYHKISKEFAIEKFKIYMKEEKKTFFKLNVFKELEKECISLADK